ncbi:hypothetical protein SAMN04489724_0071 [Algoriphagus locisalis]|uniref:Uncharacterized protein n=1 Tax=Algoriphagus locisalis TaxID=305507 RepID=A0A1I7E4V5_9BACT|nr:hypothetical protein SAMN04489724_0071 [Algoriphagus locisalis]
MMNIPYLQILYVEFLRNRAIQFEIVIRANEVIKN